MTMAAPWLHGLLSRDKRWLDSRSVASGREPRCRGTHAENGRGRKSPGRAGKTTS